VLQYFVFIGTEDMSSMTCYYVKAQERANYEISHTFGCWNCCRRQQYVKNLLMRTVEHHSMHYEWAKPKGDGTKKPVERDSGRIW